MARRYRGARGGDGADEVGRPSSRWKNARDPVFRYVVDLFSACLSWTAGTARRRGDGNSILPYPLQPPPARSGAKFPPRRSASSSPASMDHSTTTTSPFATQGMQRGKRKVPKKHKDNAGAEWSAMLNATAERRLSADHAVRRLPEVRPWLSGLSSLSTNEVRVGGAVSNWCSIVDDLETTEGYAAPQSPGRTPFWRAARAVLRRPANRAGRPAHLKPWEDDDVPQQAEAIDGVWPFAAGDLRGRLKALRVKRGAFLNRCGTLTVDDRVSWAGSRPSRSRVAT